MTFLILQDNEYQWLWTWALIIFQELCFCICLNPALHMFILIKGCTSNFFFQILKV